MKEYNVKDRQTLIDVAIICFGGIENLIALAEKNNVSITSELTAGYVIEMGGIEIQDRQVVRQYNYNDIVPATGISTDEILEGIEFWGIEIDYIIS
ncbi:MAG: hypothetical protein RSA53_05545 [Odoribacter sp.]